jgi:thiol-disulfide isomerase/thioredoxin
MKNSITWRIFGVYLFIMFLMLLCGIAFGQVKVVHYNADWNKNNNVKWLEELTDCKIKYVDIVEDPTVQKKQEIVVVPTIIIFKDGEEVKRFQANISFTMKATKEDIQEVIDEQLMSDF